MNSPLNAQDLEAIKAVTTDIVKSIQKNFVQTIDTGDQIIDVGLIHLALLNTMTCVKCITQDLNLKDFGAHMDKVMSIAAVFIDEHPEEARILAKSILEQIDDNHSTQH